MVDELQIVLMKTKARSYLCRVICHLELEMNFNQSKTDGCGDETNKGRQREINNMFPACSTICLEGRVGCSRVPSILPDTCTFQRRGSILRYSYTRTLTCPGQQQQQIQQIQQQKQQQHLYLPMHRRP